MITSVIFLWRHIHQAGLMGVVHSSREARRFYRNFGSLSSSANCCRGIQPSACNTGAARSNGTTAEPRWIEESRFGA